MAGYVGFRDGGKTNEEGLAKYLRTMYTAGVPTSYSASSLQVTQRGAGANMSVDVAVGDAHLTNPTSTYSYWGWFDATTNQAITTADVSNPRIDVIGVYVDLSVVASVSNNNPGAFKTFVSTGTPAASPVANSDAAIQTALGSTTPFIKLATVLVAAGAANITSGVITDVRSAMTGRLPAVSLVGTDGWVSGLPAPTSVVYNGGRIATLTFTGDQTSKLSFGTRGRTTNSVAQPTQSISLNGTTQSLSRTTPAGMTFTNNFTVMAWVKLASYPSGAAATILSRYNGTSGFRFDTSAGQIRLIGHNGGVSNIRYTASYQAVPLNKWTHIAASIDMLGNTGAIYIDGNLVTSQMLTGGTAPTAIVQAGNLEIGSSFGVDLFPGKIAQPAVFSAVLSQATIQSYIEQGLAGTETSLVSAYSLNGVATDLNSTNANNLTLNGSPSYAADSFTGWQANGTINSLLNYFVTQSCTFGGGVTTAVVQIPEGCTIPQNGIASVSYSSNAYPYNFPGEPTVVSNISLQQNQSGITTTTDILGLTSTITVPPKKSLRIGFYANGLQGSTSGTGSVILAQDGVQITSESAFIGTATGSIPVALSVTFAPTPGTHTYKIQASVNSGSATMIASPASPAQLTIEYVNT